MPKSQKKSKKSKEPKHKPQTQQSFDEIEESLLLGEDDPIEPVNYAKTRKNSLESSLLEDELLGESPVVVKKSKRRKTKNSVSGSKTDRISISELEISLTTSERDDSISESLLRSPTFIESPDISSLKKLAFKYKLNKIHLYLARRYSSDKNTPKWHQTEGFSDCRTNTDF